MTLFERLRRLFQRSTIPEDARRVYEASKSTDELVSGLEQVLGRNRIEYDGRYEELVAVSRMIRAERSRLAAGGLDPADEDRLMDSLDIRQSHYAPLKSSVAYLKANMLVLIRLIGRIREQQARELRGINEDDIDGIMEAVNDEIEAYARDMAAAGDEEAAVHIDDDAEAEARAERRRKLLGQEGAPAAPTPPAKDTPAKLPTKRKPETE